MERRAHARNDRCQRCSGACCAEGENSCVGMCKSAKLYALSQEDFAVFEKCEMMQNKGTPKPSPLPCAHGVGECDARRGACSRTPLAAVFWSMCSRRCRRCFALRVRWGGGRLLLLQLLEPLLAYNQSIYVVNYSIGAQQVQLTTK